MLNWWPSSIRSPANRERVAAECRTEAAGRLRRPARPDRRRGDRRPHQPAPRASPASFSKPASICWSKSRSAPTRAEADELVAVARRRSVVLQVGHVERFNPAFHAAAPQLRQSEVHRGRPGQRLHLPLDRRGRGARPDDSRHRPGAVAGPQPAAEGRRPGRFGARRARRRGQRPAGVRVRLRGHALGVARQLRAGAADAGLVGRRRLPASTLPPEPPRSSAPAKRSCGGSSTSTGFRRSRSITIASTSPKSICRASNFNATPSMPWRWSWTISASRSARRASRASTARRAATPWRWPSRFLRASTPTRWDASIDGPAGPLALPRRHVIPAPHFAPLPREKAG